MSLNARSAISEQALNNAGGGGSSGGGSGGSSSTSHTVENTKMTSVII